MREIYLGNLTNQGDKLKNIKGAILALKERGVEVLRCSPLYCTSPVGPIDQDWFINGVLLVKTQSSPKELLSTLLKIEEDMGRKRWQKWGPRVIDLDILIYGDLIVDEEGLVIPHPHMAKREFVMRPMVDIAPALIHPVLKSTMEDLLASLLALPSDKRNQEQVIYLGSMLCDFL